MIIKSSLRSQKAFSLIEMLLVLGVLSVLLIAAFVVYPRVRTAQQVTTEVENIALIHAGINKMYMHNGNNYKDLTLDAAKKAKIFPDNMVSAAGVVTNSWGGTVVLGPSANPYSGMSSYRTYVLRYRNVPADACVALVSQTASYFTAIGVGTESRADGSYSVITHVLTDANSTGYNKGPNTGLQIDTLTAACASRDASEVMFIAN